MRELVTIGDLGLLGAASPNARSRLRRMSYVRHAMIRSIGQTNPNFVPGVDSTTAGTALIDAGETLLNYFDVNGVPSEHINDPNVMAFQTTWNADPGNAAANAKLSPDGGYGANVHVALDALTGVAPNVNTGGAPAPSPSPSPSPVKPTPSTPTAPTHTAGMSGGALLLLLAAAAGVGYLVFGRKKRMTSVVVRRNPRRARRRRML